MPYDEYDAGYESGIESLTRDIHNLQAENAELRDQLRESDACADEMAALYCDRIARLEDDNAKLRKLVADMWGWLTSRLVNGAALHDISGQMHKLGIKVDK